MKSNPIRFHIACIAIALGLLLGCSTAPEKPETIFRDDYAYLKKALAWEIEQKKEQSGTVGLSIAIVDDQGLIWSQGFGHADKARQVPATPATIYRVGSISKVFTAMGVMQLAERGRVNIDTPLVTYLPDFSIQSRFGSTDAITCRNIMTHHSGLPGDLLKGWASEENRTLLTRLAHETTAAAPNTIFAYSNAGVSLLGLMIEEVTGRVFETHMNENLFAPMGMTHTSYSLQPHMAPRLASGYAEGYLRRQLPIRDQAAGSVYSSVDDMSRFMRTVLNRGRTATQAILSAETLDTMTRAQNDDCPLDFDFSMGLGWILDGIKIDGARKVIWHDGATLYFSSHMALLPQEKLGVVVLSNSAEGEAIVSEIGNRALAIALETKHGIRPAQQKKEEHDDAPLNGFDPKQAANIAGHYGIQNDLIEIRADGDRLIARVDNTDFDLVPYEDGTFGVKKNLLGLIPVPGLDVLRFSYARVAEQEVIVMHVEGLRQPLAKKIANRPVPDSWATMAGAYEVVNPDPYLTPRSIELTVQSQALVVTLELPMVRQEDDDIYFEAISESEAITMGIGRYAGETLRIVDIDGEPGLYYSGYTMRKKPL